MVIKKERQSKNEFLAVSLVLIAIGFMVFVSTSHVVQTKDGTTSFSVSEDVSYNYTITVNNTGTSNITTVNISLMNITWGGSVSFTFDVGDTNGTDANVGDLNVTTTNTSATSHVLSFVNSTTALVNITASNVTHFWFNATASHYGTYKINVTSYNSSGYSNSTLLTVTVVDNSTAPNVSTPVGPVRYGNYSGFININVSINDSYGTMDTVIFNITNNSGFVTNYTAVQQGTTTYWNATVDTTGFDDFTNYNLTIIANDTSYNVNSTKTIQNITFDNTAPYQVDFNSTQVTNGNYSGILNFNVSVLSSTAAVETVFFNITNITGGQNATYTAAKSGNHYNYTIDTNSFPDGTYNITVWANDSAGNLNNTVLVYDVTFDNTAPSAIVLASSSATQTSLTLTITITEPTSEINKSCSVDSSGGGTTSISGTTTSQTLTETGLTCGTTYDYIVYCDNSVGKTGSSSTTPFTTSACSGGGDSPSGGSSPPTWTNTYTLSDEDFEAGKDIQRGIKERVRVRVTGSGGAIETHHVGIKEVTLTTATIEIASDPVLVKLNIDEDAKVDVTDDGVYDIYVKLLGIINGKANILVQEIHEEIPEEIETGEGVETTGEIIEGDVDGTEEKDLTWLWIVIGIIVLVAIIGGGIAAKKRK